VNTIAIIGHKVFCYTKSNFVLYVYILKLNTCFRNASLLAVQRLQESCKLTEETKCAPARSLDGGVNELGGCTALTLLLRFQRLLFSRLYFLESCRTKTIVSDRGGIRYALLI